MRREENNTVPQGPSEGPWRHFHLRSARGAPGRLQSGVAAGPALPARPSCAPRLPPARPSGLRRHGRGEAAGEGRGRGTADLGSPPELDGAAGPAWTLHTHAAALGAMQGRWRAKGREREKAVHGQEGVAGASPGSARAADMGGARGRSRRAPEGRGPARVAARTCRHSPGSPPPGWCSLLLRNEVWVRRPRPRAGPAPRPGPAPGRRGHASKVGLRVPGAGL